MSADKRMRRALSIGRRIAQSKVRYVVQLQVLLLEAETDAERTALAEASARIAEKDPSQSDIVHWVAKYAAMKST